MSGNLISLPKSRRIAVAMSGGVDSSTLVGMLRMDGYDVIGITVRLYDDPCNPSRKSCCTSKDIEDAKNTARWFGVPHYVIDETDVFQNTVIDSFVAGWRNGQTPNPCVTCNTHMKFEPILDYARSMGCSAMATGHYARLENGRIRRATNLDKDQSYFLWGVSPSTLKHVYFPLGEMGKEHVRDQAERFGLSVHNKRDSQDVCFVGGDMKAYLASHGFFTNGDLVHDGRVVGRHVGLHSLTIGQKVPNGLRVLGKDASTNTVRVGPKPETTRKTVFLTSVAWHEPPPVGTTLMGQTRSRGTLSPVEVTDVMTVTGDFDFDPSPGQSLVLWRDDILVGGGVVAHVS